MNRLIIILSLLYILPCTAKADNDIERVLSRLDDAIGKSDQFDNEKIGRINALRSRLSVAADFNDRYAITRDLISEFESYRCDSALHYANLNIDLSERHHNPEAMTEAILSKCDILGHAGLFSEAVALLSSIDQASLQVELRRRYYSVAYSIYQYMYENAMGTEYEDVYAQSVSMYCDSALALSRPHTFDHVRLEAAKMIRNRKYDLAAAKLDSAARSYNEGLREYSVIRSTQALPVGQLDPDGDEQLVLLAQAALSDIRGSIKENMALRSLAERLCERGNVERADRFVKKSMEDAAFFSARMRTAQAAQMLPLIDRQCDLLRQETQTRMHLIIFALMIVAAIFAAGTFALIRLTRRLSGANERLKKSNAQIRDLNSELRDAADLTKDLNMRLREANRIKETYLRQFMEMSSRSINSLEHFRKSMLLMMATGKTDDVKRALHSHAAVTDALKDLYRTFDSAFLTIFPDFIERFNALLRLEERSETGPDEPFSTEMRIYALIRMGITDNRRISEFLRCSLSTVYTYRSKMKARAIDPERFESELLAISAIDDI